MPALWEQILQRALLLMTLLEIIVTVLGVLVLLDGIKCWRKGK